MSKVSLVNPPEKVRLNLELSRQVHEQMLGVQERTGAASLTEVIRRSMALYDFVTEHTHAGGQLILRYEDGNEETLRIV